MKLEPTTSRTFINLVVVCNHRRVWSILHDINLGDVINGTYGYQKLYID